MTGEADLSRDPEFFPVKTEKALLDHNPPFSNENDTFLTFPRVYFIRGSILVLRFNSEPTKINE